MSTRRTLHGAWIEILCLTLEATAVELGRRTLHGAWIEIKQMESQLGDNVVAPYMVRGLK